MNDMDYNIIERTQPLISSKHNTKFDQNSLKFGYIKRISNHGQDFEIGYNSGNVVRTVTNANREDKLGPKLGSGCVTTQNVEVTCMMQAQLKKLLKYACKISICFTTVNIFESADSPDSPLSDEAEFWEMTK